MVGFLLPDFEQVPTKFSKVSRLASHAKGGGLVIRKSDS